MALLGPTSQVRVNYMIERRQCVPKRALASLLSLPVIMILVAANRVVVVRCITEQLVRASAPARLGGWGVRVRTFVRACVRVWG